MVQSVSMKCMSVWRLSAPNDLWAFQFKRPKGWNGLK